jgi:transcriptional regulator with XRE-family HTH domain
MQYDSNAIEIGKRLAECRSTLGKSLAEVAETIGISPSALSMYESGERIPRDNIKIRLSQYYNVPIQTLFFAKTNHET